MVTSSRLGGILTVSSVLTELIRVGGRCLYVREFLWLSTICSRCSICCSRSERVARGHMAERPW